MNTSVFIDSLKYLQKFTLPVSLASWTYQELKTIRYSDLKLVRSFKKWDYEVTENIVSLISDSSILDQFVFPFYMGDIHKIISLLLIGGIDVHCRSDDLFLWSVSGEFFRRDVVKMLIDAGADIHSELDNTLRSACYYGRLELASLLLENGADINACSNESLQSACHKGHTEIVKILLASGAVPTYYNMNSGRWDIWKESPLSIAKKYGHIEIVQLLEEAILKTSQ